jgi:Ca2+-binding EF-hand superfamily protein
LYDQIPPQEIARLQQWFAGVDRDRSGSISAPELAGVVFGGKPIGQLTATKLIKVFDRDNSGTIDFKEYASLNQYLMNMFNAFSNADRDRSGFVDAQEIHQAMAGAGFQLSIGSITALVTKFSTPGRGVDIANFLFICAHLGHLRSIFEWNDSDRDGKVTLTYDSLTHIGTEIL